MLNYFRSKANKPHRSEHTTPLPRQSKRHPPSRLMQDSHCSESLSKYKKPAMPPAPPPPPIPYQGPEWNASYPPTENSHPPNTQPRYLDPVIPSNPTPGLYLDPVNPGNTMPGNTTVIPRLYLDPVNPRPGLYLDPANSTPGLYLDPANSTPGLYNDSHPPYIYTNRQHPNQGQRF